MTFILPTKISVYIIITFTGIIILTDNITNCRGTMYRALDKNNQINVLTGRAQCIVPFLYG